MESPNLLQCRRDFELAASLQILLKDRGGACEATTVLTFSGFPVIVVTISSPQPNAYKPPRTFTEGNAV
ncbi:hypothetical protein FF1_004985 [Malus domestica]